MTPEKIARSDVLMRTLDQINQQGRLDRVVVDEAHCVSQVGSFFVTAEHWLVVSVCVMGTLDQINEQGRLDRIVTDEAHCVSQVGTIVCSCP